MGGGAAALSDTRISGLVLGPVFPVIFILSRVNDLILCAFRILLLTQQLCQLVLLVKSGQDPAGMLDGLVGIR